MSDDPLETPVQFVPGVGPARAELLTRLEIVSVADLLWHMPHEVLDLTDLTDVKQLVPDRMQSVRGTVVDIDAREISGGRILTAVLIQSGSAYVRGVWFNQPWMIKKFRPAETVLFSAKPKKRSGRWEFSNPHVRWIADDEGEGAGELLPRYRLTEGIKMHILRRCIRSALDKFLEYVPDFLTLEFRQRYSLPEMQNALDQVHRPRDMDAFDAGKRRLIFDDLLEFQLALAIRRRAWKQFDAAPVLPTTAKIDARIRRLFPFDFTAGQNQAVREITTDLATGHAMHRLFQADVGAGKTAVAIYAMLVTVAADYQTVLMAPTELLASQHWATIDRILEHSRVKRILLTGNLTPVQRRQALDEIRNGDVQLIVGTQAVIQDDVEFDRLALAIIDEQHKFGVQQRARFSTGDSATHVLVMTATPIPRSICLTQFGDLDITTVSDLPPGRKKVITSRVDTTTIRDKVWKFIREKMREGRQLYVVCPRVERDSAESSEGLSKSAEEAFEQLSATELKEFSIGLLHGQMDRHRKTEVMQQFREGELRALVATTVIEVGVDVGNATLMVILHAEHFGLSQLHQLRGRIARGKLNGYCFLFSDATNSDAQRRLAALESTSNGFQIAEADFELRGPGDILGTRQHGQLPLRVADLVRDQKVLLEARTAAFELVKSEEFDQPHFAPLKIRVLERFGRLMDLPKSG